MIRGTSGSVGLTLLLPVVVAAMLVLLVGATLGAVDLADARAADAADAAAIAVVHARLAGHVTPCATGPAAVDVAPGHARVTACRLTDDGGARVSVAVRVPATMAGVLGMSERRAEAGAAPVWTPGLPGRPVGG